MEMRKNSFLVKLNYGVDNAYYKLNNNKINTKTDERGL